MRRAGVVAICIFIVAISSGALFISVRSPAGTLLWKLCWVMLCFIGLYVAHRMRFHAAVRELGLRAPLGRAGMAAFVASVPMLVMFALTSRPSSTLAAGPLLMTSVVSPLSDVNRTPNLPPIRTLMFPPSVVAVLASFSGAC